MNSKFEIAGLTVEPETKQRGFLRVGPYFPHENASIRRHVLIPFTVINGIEDGPTLVQIAGVHPSEYASMDATIRLSNSIKPEELKGTYISVPCVNTPGYLKRTYINPIDSKNIQDCFPGRRDGTISEMMAYSLFNDIILKSDYFVDCHGGQRSESTVWFVLFYGTNDDVEEKSKAMAKASGFTFLTREAYPCLGWEAARKGIPGILIELGSGDKLIPEESQAVFEGTLNVMRQLKMLEGEHNLIEGQPGTRRGQEQELWTSARLGDGRAFALQASHSSVYFTKGGMFHTDVKPGDLLNEGQVIGKVTNLWGDVIETIYAPATGRVKHMTHNPVVNPGDTAITLFF